MPSAYLLDVHVLQLGDLEILGMVLSRLTPTAWRPSKHRDLSGSIPGIEYGEYEGDCEFIRLQQAQPYQESSIVKESSGV